MSKVPVLAVLNMKGGVGKTTISGNLFRELYRGLIPGSKSLVIDFDAQFNLSQLVLTEKQYEKLRAAGRTIWNVMEPADPESVFDTSDLDTTKVSDAEAYTTVLKSTVGKSELHLLPGDFRMAGLNLRENSQTLELPRKRFSNLIKAGRQAFALVVLDCNPSSSFLTRCAIESSTHILVPIRPDKYSILGLKMVDDYLKQLPGLAQKPEIIVILNGVAKEESDVEREIRASAYGPQTLVTRIPQTSVLTARVDYTGFGVDRGVKNSKVIRRTLRAAASELIAKLNLKS
jgi:chromosome partitioning protein